MIAFQPRPGRNFWLGIAIAGTATGLSAVNPVHRGLWFAHSCWVIAGLLILVATRRRFVFSPLAYTMMAVYAAAMLIGAHYTYEQEPLFNWLRETCALQRNYYDRFTHLLQGLVPALLIRETLVRRQVLARRRWLPFMSVTICLAASAFYELIEWWFAVATGTRPDISLGMQGDFWDTQWDMLMALTGSILSLSLAGLHDRQLHALLHPAQTGPIVTVHSSTRQKNAHDPDQPIY